MEFKYVPTTCPYCGTGCGFNLVVRDKKVVGVQPWHRNPVNEGKLCPKGNYAWQFINNPDRLTKPLIKKDGKFVEASWDEAYKLIAQKFKSYKGEEMACLASARVSNEENYLMQKFARAVLKTPNIDHCARLCHASTVVGLAGSFGSGAMTQSIADIAESKCLLVIGTNTFEQHPLIGRRIIQAKAKGAKIIYADPRLTPTGKVADLHLQFYSGTDVALLNCFHAADPQERLGEQGVHREKDQGLREGQRSRDEGYVLPRETLKRSPAFPQRTSSPQAEWFGTSGQSAVLYSMGITQHTTGVDNVKSVANLQMLTGNLGRPGTGICALRGQNNVQGACDMGALANVYSGYQSVLVPEMKKKMEDAWGCDIAEGKVGLTVTTLVNTLADEPGKVKGLYIMGENPMLSDPDLNHVEKALKNVEFMVVQDIFLTETAQMADVVLPAIVLCRKRRHPDFDRAPGPAVEKGTGPARRGKGGLAHHFRACKVHGIRKAVPVQERRGDLYRDSKGHPLLWRHGLRAAFKTRRAPLALPDKGAPGNPHPPQGKVLPPGRALGSLPRSSGNRRRKFRMRSTRSCMTYRALHLAVAYRQHDPALARSRTRRADRLDRGQPRGCKGPGRCGQGNGKGKLPPGRNYHRYPVQKGDQERRGLPAVPLRGVCGKPSDQQCARPGGKDPRVQGMRL